MFLIKSTCKYMDIYYTLLNCRCYNRYKRQYLQGKDGQEEEEEEERCPAVIPSHEVSTNSIEGAFIEREEKRKENGGKGGISSSSFLRKRKEESSAEGKNNLFFLFSCTFSLLTFFSLYLM